MTDLEMVINLDYRSAWSCL